MWLRSFLVTTFKKGLNMKLKHLFVLTVALLVSLVDINSPALSQDKPAIADDSSSHRVQKKTFKPELSLKGIIVPDKIQAVRFEMKEYKTPLKIKKIVSLGASVISGMVILELDTEPLEKTIKDAVNRFGNLKLNVEQTKQRKELERKNQNQELEKTQIRYDKSKDQLKNYKETEWPLQKDRDDLNLKHYEARLADQTVELQQLEEMYKESEIAGKTKELVLERARRDVQMAKTSLNIMQREIDYRRNTEHPKKLDDMANEEKWSKENLESLKLRINMNAAESDRTLANLEIEFKKHTEYLDDLKADLKLCVVTSAMDGVIVHGDVRQYLFSGKAPAVPAIEEMKTGDTLQQNKTVLTVYSAKKYSVDLSIPEDFRQLMKDNNSGKVFVGALADKVFSAAVSRMANLADGKDSKGLTYSANLALEDNDDRLQPGLNCAIRFEIDAVNDVIVIPSGFLTTRDGKSFVNIREGNSVSEKEVMVGLSKGDEIWVTYGLKEGDVISKKKAP
jgi:multidrug efflux pump subunit AcrA (membrane-fusion protein)